MSERRRRKTIQIAEMLNQASDADLDIVFGLVLHLKALFHRAHRAFRWVEAIIIGEE